MFERLKAKYRRWRLGSKDVGHQHEVELYENLREIHREKGLSRAENDAAIQATKDFIAMPRKQRRAYVAGIAREKKRQDRRAARR